MYPNSANKRIPRHIFEEPYLKISFSEHGEDEYARAYFWKMITDNTPGFYLDIGCFQENLHSNTKLLSLAGWAGIAIDANPDFQEQWKNARKRDIFYNIAISDNQEKAEHQKVKFYRFQGGEISTTVLDVAKKLIKDGCPFRDTIKVPSLRLEEVAAMIKANHPGFRPNFLSIDIEECDYLSSLEAFLDQLEYPELLCLEWINKGYDIYNFQESNECKILHRSGYKIETLTPSNIIASSEKCR